MVFKSKDDFYYALSADYKDNVEESFIFKYLKGQKDDKACPEAYRNNEKKTRKDAYITLQSCFKAYEEDQITAEEFKSVLLKDIRKIAPKEMRVVLGISADDPKQKELKKSDLIEKIEKEIEKELKTGAVREDGVIDQLLTRLGSVYLKEDIYDYLYNSLNSRPGSGGRKRRNDEPLDMMIRFLQENYKRADDNGCKEMQGAGGVTDKLEDKEYVKDCEELYKYINGMDLESGSYVFVPLAIDRDTGLGLYMIGSEYLFGDDKKKKDNCYYCIMRFDDPDSFFGAIGDIDYADTGDAGNIDKGRFRMTYHIENGGIPIRKLDEAISVYGAVKKSFLDYDGYGGANENAADGLSECASAERFRNYFEKTGEAELREDEEERKLEAGQSMVLTKIAKRKALGSAK